MGSVAGQGAVGWAGKHDMPPRLNRSELNGAACAVGLRGLVLGSGQALVPALSFPERTLRV